MKQPNFKKVIKVGGLLKSDSELGEVANEIMFLFSQRQLLHRDVETVFEIIRETLGHAPVSYNDIVSSIEGTLSLQK